MLNSISLYILGQKRYIKVRKHLAGQIMEKNYVIEIDATSLMLYLSLTNIKRQTKTGFTNYIF